MIRYVLNTLGSFRSALVVGVGLPFLVAASAFAQTPEATTERVIVTGSYIPTAETESALPVTVYTAEVMQKQGANTPAEALRQLPSFVGNAQTETNSNGGDGTALINLRALGTVNVLTLVNGRRTFNFRDINLIPIGGISRTEVLKDGASSIYGSDAVAGVVNFIMLDGPTEKPYEGAELFGRYDNTTENDGHVRQVYLRGGVTGLDGKVSIAAAGEYYSRASIYSRDRQQVSRTGDLSNNPGDPNYPSSSGMQWGGTNNNSQTFSGRVAVNASASTRFPVTGQLVLINPGNGAVTPGAYRPFVLNADASEFNFRLFTPAIPGMEKAMYMVTGRYKIFGDGLQLYGDVMYSKADQDNGLAGAPFAMNNVFNGLAEVQASHFNPFGNDVNTLRYRLQGELANRRNFFHKDAWRYVAGLNGDFNIKDNAFISRFGYDTGFVYERFDEITTTSGDARRSYLRALIAPVGFSNATAPLPIPATGQFNPFIGQYAPLVGNAPTYVNGVPTGLTEPYDNTSAIPDYTQGGSSYVGTSIFYERDYLYDAKVNAHLFPGLWNGGVDLAGGYEHRTISQQNIPDPVPLTNDTLGFTAGSASKTRQEVDSFFAELNVPLITSTMNIPFVRSLDVSFAWRYEKFKDTDLYATSVLRRIGEFTNTNEDEDFGGSPRIALRYQPIADLTLRATWGQSFRAPSPADLFSPVFQDFPVVFDPVQHVTVQPTDGVWEGGNPALLPETTDSYSAGLVWTPKFVPGFTMTLDVYQVFTKNLIIDAPSFAQILLTRNEIDPDGCGFGGGGPAAPGGTGVGVTRFPDGSLDCIDAGEGNAGKRLVEGLDITAVYELPTERFGKFTFSGGYNHFFIWKAEPGNGTDHNFLGDYSKTLPLTPGAIPFNKAFARLEWQWKGFDFVATGNYIGDYIDDPAFIAAGFDLTRVVTSYITLDMQLSYEWVKPATEAPPTYAKDAKDSKHVMTTEAATASIWQRMLWGTRLTVGVNNAFDRYPPSELGAFNDNYDTNLYSIRNRSWYVSINKKF
ncbi:MAG: iron complex outerrane recepter protein [Verrucomicrobiota bacterium]